MMGRDFGSALLRSATTLIVATGLVLAMAVKPPAAAAQEPAVEFMKRVAKDLIAAANSGSAQAFADAINRYGHFRAIGDYALGTYKPRLQPTDREIYYSGMVRFIARYAAGEAPKYPVSHAEFFSPPTHTSKGVFVDSRVHLKDGSSYDVQWRLIPHGGSYRVFDAQVLSFWMTPFLKDLFERYVNDNGGNVQALVVALNR
ncbi:MAG TPA: ABC transporter substrate-binding protein [Hyphomicrobiaceae bacterium]|nr:ABC transporter substrate-binding protein [Hyphomicrobiaceae bacterium]